MNDFKTGLLTPERLAPLQQYLEDEKITNIDWHGDELWIKTIDNESYRVDPKECKINQKYIDDLIANIVNSKSKRFNAEDNRLEVENEDLHLRITAAHDSIAMNGTCLFMRKTTDHLRYTFDELVQSKYISEELLNFLINCVIAKCNFMVGGIPEAGKSEFGKYLSLYIPDNENVVTIEDALEWYYKSLKPNAACVPFRVNKNFTYQDAIGICMRVNPDRILFTEVRSVEVMDLVELWKAGVPGICTIHVGNYNKIPGRMLNMMPTRLDADRLENSIYDDLDVGIIIKKRRNPDGNLSRYLDQAGFFVHDNGKNKAIDLFINGKLSKDNLPEKIIQKFQEAHIDNPFEFPSRLRR